MRYLTDGTPDPASHLDLVAQAKARTIQRYKNSPLFGAWRDAYLTLVQELEDTLWQFWTIRFLSVAQGVQLNYWGNIVGEQRNGETDDNVYRLRIQVRVLVNRSNGSIPTMVHILTVGSGLSGSNVVGSEAQPASLDLQINIPPMSPGNISLLTGWLYDAKAGGVRLAFIFPWDDNGLRCESELTGLFASPGMSSVPTGPNPTLGGSMFGVR